MSADQARLTLKLDPAIAAARRAAKAPPPPTTFTPQASYAVKPQVVVGNLLRRAYPIFDQQLPLAIGIHHTIFAAFPNISQKAVRAFLKLHVGRRQYLAKLVAGAPRYGLDGLPAGEVSEKQAAQAGGAQ